GRGRNPSGLLWVAGSSKQDVVFVRDSREPSDTMSGDLTLTCRDCGQAFTFTSGEQDFYASRGFSEPTRCAECRAARRAERDRGGYAGGYESGASLGPRQVYEAAWYGCGSIASLPLRAHPDTAAMRSSCFRQ